MTATPKDPPFSSGELTWTCECGSNCIIEIKGPSGDWYDLDCRHCGLVGSISIRPKAAIKPARIQTPPESADETQPQACVICGKPVHPGLAHYCSEECEELAVASPLKSPQPCEHKSIDTYQGKPFCKRCGKTVEIRRPQA